jgi:hypothetical protein
MRRGIAFLQAEGVDILSIIIAINIYKFEYENYR